MATAESVSCTIDDGVALVRLNRADKHNAFNRELSMAFIRLFDRLEEDENVRCVVLVGSGRAFSAGADMAEALDALEGESGGSDGMAQSIVRLSRFPKPVIACVNGYAYGGGAYLAITCDIRIAADSASFRFPGAVYGLVVGGSQLPRIVGPAVAKELLFSGRVIEAEEAERVGLVNHLAPPAEALDRALELAHQIAANSPEAVRLTKEVVDRATEVDEGIRREIEANRELRRSAEHRRRFREATERVTQPPRG